MGPLASAEFERLRNDGHQLSRVGSNPDSIRNTQLYRTRPHEMGHWVDWLEKVARPVSASVDRYFERPQSEREVFAHRYAEAVRDRLKNSGVIPFARMPVCPADGLNPEDFHL